MRSSNSWSPVNAMRAKSDASMLLLDRTHVVPNPQREDPPRDARRVSLCETAVCRSAHVQEALEQLMERIAP